MEKLNGKTEFELDTQELKVEEGRRTTGQKY